MEPKRGMQIVVTVQPTICTVKIARVLCPIHTVGWLVILEEGNFALCQPSDYEMTAQLYFVPLDSKQHWHVERVVERIDKNKFLTSKDSWLDLNDYIIHSEQWKPYNLGGTDLSGDTFSEDDDDEE